MRQSVTRILLPALLVATGLSVTAARRDTLPAALTDREFWSLSEQLSEPNGHFVSRSGSPDNLLSNEMDVSTVAAVLSKQIAPAGIYLGVGPEQNFSYIAATRPRMAFITDIRRGNLDLHLVYKAVFEMSANRSEFVARLFSRKPAAVSPTASAGQLMTAYLQAAPVDDAVFAANLQAITSLLASRHGFPLAADDRANIEWAYRNFHRFGPAIDYTASINGRTGRFSNYASIMSSVDRATGEERGFLASEQAFARIKTMERENLIVPVVGDFAGPKALRAIGTWLRARGATVRMFYVSNVEQYLESNGVWPAFCANVATLPLDRASVFIRPGRGSSFLAPMAAETATCTGRAVR